MSSLISLKLQIGQCLGLPCRQQYSSPFLGNYLAYHTFSSADMQRDSISKHLDSFNNLSSNLETSVISSSTGLPGPLAYLNCNKIFSVI